MSSRLSSRRDRSRDRRHSKKSGYRSSSKSPSRIRSSRRKRSRSTKRSHTRSSRQDNPIGCVNNPVSNESPPGLVVPQKITEELKNTGERLGENLVVAHLSKAAVDWLEEKVVEQVTERVKVFDDLVRQKVEKAKIEMQAMLRLQTEREMKEEIDAIERREKESKARCQALEQELQEKLKSVGEAEKKLDHARLEMLEVKGKLEMERAALQQEREAMNQKEQQSILNFGGAMRAPIKLKFGK